jgi:hypothetical protein
VATAGAGAGSVFAVDFSLETRGRKITSKTKIKTGTRSQRKRGDFIKIYLIQAENIPFGEANPELNTP